MGAFTTCSSAGSAVMVGRKCWGGVFLSPVSPIQVRVSLGFLFQVQGTGDRGEKQAALRASGHSCIGIHVEEAVRGGSSRQVQPAGR